MVYEVTLDDGHTLQVRVFRECTEDEARERVGHFYPFSTIEEIALVKDERLGEALSENEIE